MSSLDLRLPHRCGNPKWTAIARLRQWQQTPSPKALVVTRLKSAIVWILIVAGVPAAVATGWWQSLVRQHPRRAAAFALAWLLIVGCGALLRRLTEIPLNERLDQAGESINLAVGRRFSRYGKKWRRYVLTSLRLVEVKGLATVGPHTPELDEIFVNLTLVARAPHQVPGGLLADAEIDASRPHLINELLDQETPSRLAILGAPGSGKTTLLRYVAAHAANGRRRRDLPVLLILRDHARRLSEDPPPTLPQLIRERGPILEVAEPSGWWERKLHDGRCLILFDGLDEVAVDADRQVVSDWVEQQIRNFPNNDYVLTSRPHGYNMTPLAVADVLQVRPFDSSQVRRFLQGWYLATERRSVGRDGTDVQARAKDGADDLIARLHGAPQLHDLTTNPLLLTMIANVHRYRGALPGSRADLYSEICQVMLWRRQEAKRIESELPGASKERILASVAFHMMKSGVRDLAADELTRIVSRNLRRLSQNITGRQFIGEISSNGLIIERERGQYAFAHHTFGEFLAAKHIRETGQVQVLADSVNSAWWRETTLLYVAGADADAIVRACLDQDTITSLALAFDCLHAQAEIAAELRNRLYDVQDAAFRPNAVPERRKLIAGVLATRHLQYMVPTKSGSSIYPNPVRMDLYRLFLQDTSSSGFVAANNAGPDPAAEVTGASDYDAVLFANWLNSVTAESGGSTYRLPTYNEVQELVAQLGEGTAGRITNGVWTYDAAPDLWMPDHTPNLRTITRTEIHSAVTRDLPMISPTLYGGSLVLNILFIGALVALNNTPHRHNIQISDGRDLFRLAIGIGNTNTPHIIADLDSAVRLAQKLKSISDELSYPHYDSQNIVKAIRHLATNLISVRELLNEDSGILMRRDRGLSPIMSAVSANPATLSTNLHFEIARNPSLRDILASAINKIDAVGFETPGDTDLATGLGAAMAWAMFSNPSERPHMPSTSATINDINRVLAGTLLLSAGIPPNYRTHIDIDRLLRISRNTCHDLLARENKNPHRDSTNSYLSRLVSRIAISGSIAFTRSRALTTEEAKNLRLSALILAAKSNSAGHQEARNLTAIAAGITLLERTKGAIPAEKIIIARG